MTKTFDIYQTVTDRIIEALETETGKWKMPWHRDGLSSTMPINVHSKKLYRGVNVLSLWIEEMVHGYPTSVWGTYKQWKERGAQVRKGEKSTLVVFYKKLEIDDKDKPGQKKEIWMIRSSIAFNAAQVDGYEPKPSGHTPTKLERNERVDNFISATGAKVVHGGQQACYVPSADLIKMPLAEMFISTDTSSPEENYYSTHLHELTHWTGHIDRTDRDLSGFFGKKAYAMEELVAELGAAFLCAKLDVTNEPRLDHAQYLNSWLDVLKSDKKAIFKASTKAQQATDFLFDLTGEE